MGAGEERSEATTTPRALPPPSRRDSTLHAANTANTLTTTTTTTTTTQAELKHGRVAMAACLGWYVTAAGVHPAFNSQLSSDPLKAMQELPLVGWLQFVLGCGAIEWMAWQIKKRPGYKPGDILGAAEWVDDTDEGWVDYQTKELQNGR